MEGTAAEVGEAPSLDNLCAVGCRQGRVRGQETEGHILDTGTLSHGDGSRSEAVDLGFHGSGREGTLV